MRVLLDECLPGGKLKPALPGHRVRTVAEMNWRGVKNGALLALAEAAFDAFVTIDGGLPHQQNIAAKDLLVVVLNARSNRVAELLPLMPAVADALDHGSPGTVIAVKP